jgi:hypothetical protein
MIELLLILIVIGFALFLFNRFMPIDELIKQLINYVVIFVIAIIVILFILRLFGIYDGPNLRMR